MINRTATAALVWWLGSSAPAAALTPAPTAATSEELFVSRRLTKPGLFTFGIEGPAVGPDGFLYVCNLQRQGTIGRVSPSGRPEIFLELPKGSIGNGLRFSPDGRLFIADYKRHRIYRADLMTKKLEVVVEDDRMSQPNDLTIAGNGDLYASDPNWKKRSGRVWKVTPQGHLSAVSPVAETANGIDLNPDDSELFVGTQNSIWAYPVSKDGLGARRLFAKFRDFSLDGIRFDVRGRLFVARIEKGAIAVLKPNGEVEREIKLLGKDPTNLAFGGPDGRTVYVTQRDGRFIETFRTDAPGREWGILHPPPKSH